MNEAFQPFHEEDVPGMLALWHDCDSLRAWNPPLEDIALVQASPHAEILIAKQANQIVSSIMVGEDGHRAWVYYVCTHPDQRRKGFGRKAMQQAENWAMARGIPKLQLLVRRNNSTVTSFYASLGYEVGEVIQMQKWLSPERDRLYREGT
jgi:ribosomal protein S18 acetylase RimI-like enzyme